METEPKYSQLLIKKTGTGTTESLAAAKLPMLVWGFTQDLKAHKSAPLCFVRCRKQSLILITVQFASKGTSPMTLCGSCPAGESLGLLLLNGVCVWRVPAGLPGSDLLGPALQGQSAQTFQGLNIKQSKSWFFWCNLSLWKHAFLWNKYFSDLCTKGSILLWIRTSWDGIWWCDSKCEFPLTTKLRYSESVLSQVLF